ncbi:hypothetical protein SAY86_002888 [Trapa natans]|uniref:Uncharacterized protein n=1 Tax=Trapa natans TaxID=22666 RepID=A0AAN7QZZ6_TRANT|nr:hypothetical protein SAY86_002888 [Trapa natans]
MYHHPAISSLAPSISNLGLNQAFLSSNLSPQAAFTELSLEREPDFNYVSNNSMKTSNKRKLGGSPKVPVETARYSLGDEEEVRRNCHSISCLFMTS